MKTTGELVEGWRADEGIWSYTLPFTFPYYSGNYTSLNICSNGFLDFSADSFQQNLLEGLTQSASRYKHLSRSDSLPLPQELLQSNTIVGVSDVWRVLLRKLWRTALISDVAVLIQGQSGTGKQVLAESVHRLDPKRNGKHFATVNCAAITGTLAESELFGHKKGSFTSANEDKKGLFEVASNGTLFLDEIGYMPMNCQVKLLRAVEQQQIMPVGSTEPVDIDLRLIAATNRNLLQEIKEKRFREDLYYRLNVVGIHLPALQERKEDIPLLIEHFIKKYDNEMGKHCVGVSDDAMRLLMGCEWKGNIRELENVIERAVIFAESDVIDNLPFETIMKYDDKLKNYIDKRPEILQHAKILRNQIKSMGKHAGEIGRAHV